MSDLREREAAIRRAPVRCPECGGTNVVAGDPTGFACDDCGHKARLKEFRREAGVNPTPEQKAKAKADLAAFPAFLDQYRRQP